MKKHPVLYPLLLAINYVLVIAANNLSQHPLHESLRFLAVSVLISGVVLYGVYLVTRNWHRAGIISAIIIMLFLYYDAILFVLERLNIDAANPFVNLVVIVATFSLLIYAASSKHLWTRIPSPDKLTELLNVICAAAILIPIYKIVVFRKAPYESLELNNPVIEEMIEVDSLTPDIYYIILDGYGRSDILNEIYDYQNDVLMQYLRSKDFYIADQSTSNYMQTLLSVSSTLNMGYLNDAVTDIVKSTDRGPLVESVNQNIVTMFLASQGYKTISVSGGYPEVDIQGAGNVLAVETSKWLSEQELFFVSQTIIRPIFEVFDLPQGWPGYALHRTRTEFVFNQLKLLPNEIDGPKFVFAHIIAPHPPFVYDAEGNPVQSEEDYSTFDGNQRHYGNPELRQEYISDYREQIAYIDTLAIDAIDTILSETDNNVIIILQGDHGPGAFLDFYSLENTCLRERFSILNAYYAPQVPESSLYATITPVNSFRMILDAYFGTDLGVLEDRNYYATWQYPYLFTEVTGSLATPCTLP